MKKVAYFKSHKKKSGFPYEFFGLLYLVLSVGVFVYYYVNINLEVLLNFKIYNETTFDTFRGFYFSLIFLSIFYFIYNLGVIKLFKSRIKYPLYFITFVLTILYFVCGFFYDYKIVITLYDYLLYLQALYFILVILIFIFESSHLSYYGSKFMRIFFVICGISYILLLGLKIFNFQHIKYEVIYLILMQGFVNLAVLGNSIYRFLKNKPHLSIK